MKERNIWNHMIIKQQGGVYFRFIECFPFFNPWKIKLFSPGDDIKYKFEINMGGNIIIISYTPVLD